MEAGATELILRQCNLEDAPFILELVNSPDWLRFIGDRNIHSIEDAQRSISEIYHPMYEQPGFGPLAICSPQHRTPLGTVGLYKRPYLKEPDLGFALLPKYRGKGMAAAASQILLEQAKNNYGITKLNAITMKENCASIALLNRLGFSLIDAITPPNEQQSLLRYQINLLEEK